MKVKTHKRNRRVVRFFSACYGFREPFKILCDGTFIHHLLDNNITLDGQTVPKTLGGRTKLFTTRCCVEELIGLRKQLGPSCSESIKKRCSESIEAARSLVIARCDHEKKTSAEQCIEEVIGDNNSEHFFVATQDPIIREKFQEVPGVPVVYGHKNALFLEQISKSQREHANKMAKAHLHAVGTDSTLLGKRRMRDSEADAPDTHDVLEDQNLAPKSLTKSDSARNTIGLVDKARFKRNKAKGPNPLSCKKKKNKGNPLSASKVEHKDDDNAGKKRTRDSVYDENASRKTNRKRKRSRKSKSANPGETDG